MWDLKCFCGHFWTLPSAILDPVSQRPKDCVFSSEKGLPWHPFLQDCGGGGTSSQCPATCLANKHIILFSLPNSLRGGTHFLIHDEDMEALRGSVSCGASEAELRFKPGAWDSRAYSPPPIPWPLRPACAGKLTTGFGSPAYGGPNLLLR